MEPMIDAGLLAIRLAVGFIMFVHGTQKLFSWFQGEGIEAAEGLFKRLGFRPPRLMAYVAAWIETIGGVLLALGFLTPVAVVLLIATLVNVLLVHIKNGFDRRRNGFEFEFVLLAGTACVALAGAGAYSLDALLGIDLPSLALTTAGIDVRAFWAPLLSAMGAIGGLVVSSTRTRSI